MHYNICLDVSIYIYKSLFISFARSAYFKKNTNTTWTQYIYFTITVHGQADCSVLPDGHYNIGCKTYEVCDGGVHSTIECEESMVYNNVTKQCD